MCEQAVLESYVPTASGCRVCVCVCVCVCVARMDLHVCEWIFSPEIQTYCQMSAPLPQDKAPGWDPHAPVSSPRLPGLAVFPLPSWAAQL